MRIWLSVALCLCLQPGRSAASGPIEDLFEGCIIDGEMLSIDGYEFSPRGFDPRPYEGKRIELRGDLYPGDRFHPKPETLKVIGDCDLMGAPRFRRGLGFRANSKASALLTAGRPKAALEAVERALQCDGNYAPFLATRAEIHAALGQFKAALADADAAMKVARGDADYMYQSERRMRIEAAQAYAPGDPTTGLCASLERTATKAGKDCDRVADAVASFLTDRANARHLRGLTNGMHLPDRWRTEREHGKGVGICFADRIPHIMACVQNQRLKSAIDKNAAAMSQDIDMPSRAHGVTSSH